MLPKIETVGILIFLFVAVSAMEYFKIQPDRSLLEDILLAMSVNQLRQTQ